MNVKDWRWAGRNMGKFDVVTTEAHTDRNVTIGHGVTLRPYRRTRGPVHQLYCEYRTDEVEIRCRIPINKLNIVPHDGVKLPMGTIRRKKKASIGKYDRPMSREYRPSSMSGFGRQVEGMLLRAGDMGSALAGFRADAKKRVNFIAQVYGQTGDQPHKFFLAGKLIYAGTTPVEPFRIELAGDGYEITLVPMRIDHYNVVSNPISVLQNVVTDMPVVTDQDSWEAMQRYGRD